MKVYVAETGEYSDRRPVGVYTTKEKAQDMVRLCGDTNEPVEFEVDSMPKHEPGVYLYRVEIEASGFVRALYIQDARNNRARKGVYDDNDKTYSFQVWARDEHHAAKIANEKRVQLVANNIKKERTGK